MFSLKLGMYFKANKYKTNLICFRTMLSINMFSYVYTTQSSLVLYCFKLIL